MPQIHHGLLVLDKPRGITSRAAVDCVQRWFPHGTRVGHTGTLDPLATGVLVVCIGMATRLTEYVQAMSKVYRAGIQLGARSDTDDADGTVSPVAVERIPALDAVAAALQSFVGEIDQVPPSFSAAKVTGRRAYDLSRRGQQVMLQARKITIYGIEILSYQYPHLDIMVRCGKGTYIRSLARDLGQKLGCGGLIASLRRTQVGPFKVEDALPVDADPETAQSRLLPLASAVSELPRIEVNEQGAHGLMQGREIEVQHSKENTTPAQTGPCAAFDKDGQLIAVVISDATTKRIAPAKVLTSK